MSDLRDRIAAVLAKTDGDTEPDSWDYRLADAVIEDLGLIQTGGVIVGCNHE